MTKTFLNVDADAADPDSAFFHILPIPFSAESGRAALAVDGPNAILDASAQTSSVDARSKRSAFRLGVYTHEPTTPPDASRSVESLAEEVERLAREYALFSPKKFPIVLGGTSDVSRGLIRLAAKTFAPEFSVVRLSARAELNADVAENNPILLGVRSVSEADLARYPRLVDEIVAPETIDDEFERVVERFLYKAEKNVYLTIDMSVLDPSAAPGVCFPEPGGLSWRRVMELIQAVVLGKCVVGADIVGVAPLGGRNIVSEYAAARLTLKLIDLVAGKKGVAR